MLAAKVKGSDYVRLCRRCGIQRGSDAKSAICKDCRQVEPNWGKR